MCQKKLLKIIAEQLARIIELEERLNKAGELLTSGEKPIVKP